MFSFRSSRRQVFCKNGVLKISQNSKENICVVVSFLKCFRPQACNFIKIETPTQVLSCDFWQIFKNSFFHRTPPVVASVSYYVYVDIIFWKANIQIWNSREWFYYFSRIMETVNNLKNARNGYFSNRRNTQAIQHHCWNQWKLVTKNKENIHLQYQETFKTWLFQYKIFLLRDNKDRETIPTATCSRVLIYLIHLFVNFFLYWNYLHFLYKKTSYSVGLVGLKLKSKKVWVFYTSLKR